MRKKNPSDGFAAIPELATALAAIDAIDTQSSREFDDSEDLLVAKQRLKDWRKGESETISLADLMKKYGLIN
jgi:hypothetical protein